MIYLYVKTHNQTGLQYLGKTSSHDPYKYHGSGTYWKQHLDKHGYDYSTKILFESNDPKEIKEKGIYYSQLWDIVKSDRWANLKEEQGDGGAFDQTPEINAKRSATLKGRKFSEEHRRKLSEANKGKYHHSEETKRIAAMKASAKLKGRKKPEGFGKSVGDRLRGTKMSEESIIKMRSKWTDERRKQQSIRTKEFNTSRPIIECPHCGFQGTNKGNMSRYHFGNCPVIKPRALRKRNTAARGTEWKLASPTGEIVSVTNMRRFC